MYETKIDINALHVSQMTVTAPDMSLCDDYSDDLHYVLFSWLRKNVTWCDAKCLECTVSFLTVYAIVNFYIELEVCIVLVRCLISRFLESLALE